MEGFNINNSITLEKNYAIFLGELTKELSREVVRAIDRGDREFSELYEWMRSNFLSIKNDSEEEDMSVFSEFVEGKPDITDKYRIEKKLEKEGFSLKESMNDDEFFDLEEVEYIWIEVLKESLSSNKNVLLVNKTDIAYILADRYGMRNTLSNEFSY